jgi:hypothetical protein
MAGRIFVASTGPEDWKRFLLEPEKQWRTGYSAKTLAHCWEDADGFPPEISRLFTESEFARFRDIELLLAIPEYEVLLPGGRAPSCSDVFVLAKGGGQHIAIAVEGKVGEPFGQTLDEWGIDNSEGRKERFAFLKEQLGLSEDIPGIIRYQLLHRTVSALLEAKRFNALCAVMIVHSFSPEDKWFDDYQSFLNLFDVTGGLNQLTFAAENRGVHLYCGWAKGDKKYLSL